ncbi:hypothetical protein N1851_016763 [Merluccius polli]|uniref:Uncharacterized protein n=1 Tax=Merluccius polli TaxID=89951 RepID=A0AA47MQL7_MERPO|nr:hypothetical protein N1851_016763 [Merluccius polli]
MSGTKLVSSSAVEAGWETLGPGRGRRTGCSDIVLISSVISAAQAGFSSTVGPPAAVLTASGLSFTLLPAATPHTISLSAAISKADCKVSSLLWVRRQRRGVLPLKPLCLGNMAATAELRAVIYHHTIISLSKSCVCVVLNSPGPSCVSMKSDRSMNHPISFKDGNQSIEKRKGFIRDYKDTVSVEFQQERADSPGPSCVSMKSDLSMNHPPDLKDGRPPKTFINEAPGHQTLLILMSINPASCFSRRVQQERADSPGPSCVSMKSDWSMDRPVQFKDGNQCIEKR